MRWCTIGLIFVDALAVTPPSFTENSGSVDSLAIADLPPLGHATYTPAPAAAKSTFENARVFGAAALAQAEGLTLSFC